MGEQGCGVGKRSKITRRKDKEDNRKGSEEEKTETNRLQQQGKGKQDRKHSYKEKL